MTAFDLIALGDNCIDRLTGAVTADLVGGNAVNVAVQAAMLGLRTAYCGAVGPVVCTRIAVPASSSVMLDR